MSTITILNAPDAGSVSRGVINTNFANLNSDKLEAADIAGKQDHSDALDNVSGVNTGDQELSGLGAAAGGYIVFDFGTTAVKLKVKNSTGGGYTYLTFQDGQIIASDS